MALSFFGPKQNNKGGAFNLTCQSQKQRVFMTFFKQNGWDTQRQRGIFKGGERLNFALEPNELGSFIYAIRTRGQYNAYHVYDGETSTLYFSYYKIEPKQSADAKVKEGYGFKIKKGDVEISVGISTGAAMAIEQYCIFALHRIFNAIHAEDKKRFQASRNEREGEARLQQENLDQSTVDTEQSDPEEQTNEVSDW